MRWNRWYSSLVSKKFVAIAAEILGLALVVAVPVPVDAVGFGGVWQIECLRHFLGFVE